MQGGDPAAVAGAAEAAEERPRHKARWRDLVPSVTRVPCPHCKRKFERNAAERHIPICAQVCSCGVSPDLCHVAIGVLAMAAHDCVYSWTLSFCPFVLLTSPCLCHGVAPPGHQPAAAQGGGRAQESQPRRPAWGAGEQQRRSRTW